MRGLKGKAVIVTGAGSGIGRAIARRLGVEGLIVAVFDINRVAGAEVASAIEAEGGKAYAVACDITDYSQVAAAVAEFESQAGRATDGNGDQLVRQLCGRLGRQFVRLEA